MSFSYAVLSEQEAEQERYSLLKEGIYDALISKSLDTISSNTGNPMMDMTITVFDEQGKPHDIRDFLVFTPKMMWKVRRCAESAGVLEEYELQKFCSEPILQKSVKVKVGIESGSVIPEDKLKGKPFGSKYPDKNKIEDYIKKSDKNPSNPEGERLEDDDVPF